MFQARAQAVLAAFTNAPSPRDLSADAQLDHDDHAANLEPLGFSTRLPNTLGAVAQVIGHALTGDTWPPLDENTRDQRLAWCHDGIAQRWLVVPSPAALERAEAPVNNARPREEAAIAPPLCHRQAQRFKTPEMAQAALTEVARRWTSHQVESYTLLAHTRDARQGRPTPPTPLKASAWHIQAHAWRDQEARAHRTPDKACCVLGTNMDASEWRDPEVIQAYQGQSRGEGGVRFRNDPRLLVASVLLKKPCRIQGLLLVMTRALLVSAVTPRRLRQEVAAHHETVPNHMHQPTTAPT